MGLSVFSTMSVGLPSSNRRILSNVFNIGSKISEQFQGRVERLKNELERKEKAKERLEGMPCNAKRSKKITRLNARIDELHGLLKNAAR